MVYTVTYTFQDETFQCSSASRKFLNTNTRDTPNACRVRFSALQRAENSSILNTLAEDRIAPRFQCSSASRKFLNTCGTTAVCGTLVFQCSSASRKFLNTACLEVQVPKLECFSALQRAENSSIVVSVVTTYVPKQFQCSSASRKFLNKRRSRTSCKRIRCFSALQRAENSSIFAQKSFRRDEYIVSVLFSEPKIPQYCTRRSDERERKRVSVLFSEPKIPQWSTR